MTRIGMTLAAVVAGGVLLVAGEAGACEGHAQAKADAPPAAVEEKAEKAPELHAAKCQCGSAADCTCKKGTCECPKCKKPKRDVVEPLREQTRAPQPRKARYDASAGLFM
jgi:hypothetical protein